jgi:hypothetical protein
MYILSHEGKKQVKREMTSIYLYEMMYERGTDQSVYN